jgi:hypothetical protein
MAIGYRLSAGGQKDKLVTTLFRATSAPGRRNRLADSREPMAERLTPE